MKGIKLAKGIVIGAAGAMVTALVLGTIAAAMIHGGIIPMGGMAYCAWGITLVAGIAAGNAGGEHHRTDAASDGVGGGRDLSAAGADPAGTDFRQSRG